MGSWYFVASVGPVGGFIGGGRRSRDLWWGSTWVSECTAHAAEALRAGGEGVELLVPTWDRLRQVLDCNDQERTPSKRYAPRISNKIEARVTAGSAEVVRRLAEAARQAARDHLAAQLRATRKPGQRWQALQGELDRIRHDNAFEDQVKAIEDGDFVEFFAAWTPRTNDPQADRNRAFELLSSRKNARLFLAPTWSREGWRKSDLDAGRDTVLVDPGGRDAQHSPGDLYLARRRLGIHPEEHLDAVGLGRRLSGFVRPGPDLERLPFPPLSRVAADPWLRRAAEESRTRGAFNEVDHLLRRGLEDSDPATKELFFAWCSPARDPERAWEEHDQEASLFPYDASFLMEGGLEALLQEIERVSKRMRGGAGSDQVTNAKDHLLALRPAVRHLHQELGAPQPYFALLDMDGDGVGNALAAPGQSIEDRVGALDRFADRAAEVIAAHYGCPFYVGGDELAAYLPVDTALEAASQLERRFRDEVAPSFPPGSAVTLSASLVIAHVKADLRAIRRRGLEALAAAKKCRHDSATDCDRAWLQVVELPRSGNERVFTGPLDGSVERLQRWRRLLAGERLSLRSPYLLAGLAERLAQEGAGAEDDTLGVELARARILAQRERSTQGEGLEGGAEIDAQIRQDVEALEARLDALENWREVRELAAELAIVPRFHRIGRQRPAAGRPRESRR